MALFARMLVEDCCVTGRVSGMTLALVAEQDRGWSAEEGEQGTGSKAPWRIGNVD